MADHVNIVMDGSIMDQVIMGNPEIAKVVLRLFRTPGVQLWTPRENYQMRPDAVRIMIDSLNIQVPLQMSDQYLKTHQVAIDKANLVSSQSRTAAALALHLKLQWGGSLAKLEIMSVDKDAANPARPGGYKVIAPLTQQVINVRTITFNKNQVDYVRAARLLEIRPRNIEFASGKELPTPKPRVVKNGKPVVTLDGKPVVQVERVGSYGSVPEKARTVQQPKVVNPPRPSVDPKEASGRVGKAAAVDLGLRGAHALVHWINDAKQLRLFNEDWAKKKRFISDELDAKPSLGALVFAYYSQRQKVAQEKDNSEQFVRQFLRISYEFGRTESEAMRKFSSRKTEMHAVGPGDVIPEKVAWIPPTTPVDPSKLPTPFPPEALATFVAGHDLVMDVKWRGAAGFDDIGKTRLGAANRLEPLFLVLSAPQEIRFYNGSIQHTVHINLSGEYPAETEVTLQLPLTTVELDCSVRFVCGDTSAAMVYPADEYTQALFGKAPPIKSATGQLHYHGLEHVRFVEPENIRMLRDFRQERKGT